MTHWVASGLWKTKVLFIPISSSLSWAVTKRGSPVHFQYPPFAFLLARPLFLWYRRRQKKYHTLSLDLFLERSTKAHITVNCSLRNNKKKKKTHTHTTNQTVSQLSIVFFWVWDIDYKSLRRQSMQYKGIYCWPTTFKPPTAFLISWTDEHRTTYNIWIHQEMSGVLY